MAFNLSVCEGENNKRSIHGFTPEAIDRAIDALIPAMYHFVILEAVPPINHCAYVQALIEYEGRMKGQYLVETRYKFAHHHAHYRKHVADAAEVKRLFRAFADGVAPNTAGWRDVTAKLSK